MAVFIVRTIDGKERKYIINKTLAEVKTIINSAKQANEMISTNDDRIINPDNIIDIYMR